MRVAPHEQSNRTRYDGFYVQDQWTHRRLTVQAALRYEHAWSWFPEGENGILADNQFRSRYIFPRRMASRAFTTSRRAWALPTISLGTAKRP
jgi:hypothetical protein